MNIVEKIENYYSCCFDKIPSKILCLVPSEKIPHPEVGFPFICFTKRVNRKKTIEKAIKYLKSMYYVDIKLIELDNTGFSFKLLPSESGMESYEYVRTVIESPGIKKYINLVGFFYKNISTLVFQRYLNVYRCYSSNLFCGMKFYIIPNNYSCSDMNCTSRIVPQDEETDDYMKYRLEIGKIWDTKKPDKILKPGHVYLTKPGSHPILYLGESDTDESKFIARDTMFCTKRRLSLFDQHLNPKYYHGGNNYTFFNSKGTKRKYYIDIDNDTSEFDFSNGLKNVIKQSIKYSREVTIYCSIVEDDFRGIDIGEKVTNDLGKSDIEDQIIDITRALVNTQYTKDDDNMKFNSILPFSDLGETTQKIYKDSVCKVINEECISSYEYYKKISPTYTKYKLYRTYMGISQEEFDNLARTVLVV